MLDKFEEMEFISRVNLPRMTRVPSGYNFECFYCKEGKSAGRKKRGFILTNSHKHNYNTYSCRNCGVTHSFKHFLQDYSSSLYEEYEEKEKKIWLENIRKKEIEVKKKPTKKKPTKTISDLPFESSILMDLSEENGFILAKQHKAATNYCLKRKIPLRAFKGFYFNKDIEVESNGKMHHYYNMLVMPFYYKEKIYGYQARSIKNKTFYTCSSEGYKIYNLYNIDNSSRVYILESIMDSIFVANSIAMVGASISQEHLEIINDPVFVFDNDVSKDTLGRMIDIVEKGYKVVIWPPELKYKDVNEMIVNGYTKPKILKLINENIFEGVQAMIHLKVLMGSKKRR